MRKYFVEKEFKHEGLKCVVIMTSNAHRCGYVGIPDTHSLYGKDYDEYEVDFDCHGGITYAGGGKQSEYPIKSDLWWFGFDCLHCDDSKDYETAKRLFADDKEILKQLALCEQLDYQFQTYDGKSVRTLEYVTNECEKLAEQLTRF